MATSAAHEVFWIYDSRVRRYAAIHRADCGFCSQGTGMGGGYNPLLASWRGPFRSLDEAAHHVFAGSPTLREMRYCLRCV